MNEHGENMQISMRKIESDVFSETIQLEGSQKNESYPNSGRRFLVLLIRINRSSW